MMRITRGVIICMLVGVIIMAGCTKKMQQTVTTTPGDSGAGINAPNVSIVLNSSPADKTEENKTFDAKIIRFLAKHSNVKIAKNPWAYQNTEIAAKMVANTAPTEFTTWATEGRLLSDRNWIADLSENLASWPYTKDLNQTALQPFVIKGKIYAVPIDVYFMTITINKKLFADKGIDLPPLDWTWGDLMKAAKAVNDPAKGIAGFIPMGKRTEAGWNWTNFLYSAGGEVETLADGKVTAAFNSEAGVKAMTFYKDLNDAGVLPLNWALAYSDALTMFNQGKGAMVMSGSGNAIDSAINQGGLKAADLALYPIPAMVKGGKHIGVLGGNYKVVNGQASKNEQQAAFDFIIDEYFSDVYIDAISKQIDEQKAINKVYVPALINYWDDKSDYGKKVTAMFAKHDNIFVYAPELSALFVPKPEATYESQAYYAELTKVIQKVFTTPDVDVKALLDEAATRLQIDVFDKVKIG
ncbi:ABC transporter substrate-binding protein [Paenibacillus psychroresistens]|uniref:ABC transporter substrate-binding protein n=1 Tax=Paenibacillus psychroresistens TaxID=1778678 RepID=A0A6B8REN0_9BACL|nr:extracellular solute-binding protein [Paenibacillus psychroresistens]QGQ94387.1 ABC transporter substrate-binding protein [Paenibacillus psychroresistens]